MLGQQFLPSNGNLYFLQKVLLKKVLLKNLLLYSYRAYSAYTKKSTKSNPGQIIVI